MRIVIAGGTGHLGRLLTRYFSDRGDAAVILTRGADDPGRRLVHWDGRTLGPWTTVLDGADVIVNLAGRSVNCRYTPHNLQEMYDSRVNATRALGQAIAGSDRPPGQWLQMSTATIYAHRYDAANDEATGLIGGEEADVPSHWRASIDIATAWEAALWEAELSSTRRTRSGRPWS